MKICVLGNSHVACLKEAWTQLQAMHPDIDVRFFASPASGLLSLELHDGCLKPSSPRVVEHLRITSGGLEFVRLDDFDVFFVHGLRLAPLTLPGHLSRAVIRRSVANGIEASINLRICRMILAGSSRPVYAGHAPMRAVAADPEVTPYDQIVEVMRELLAEHGVSLVGQPMETVMLPLSTREEYARGSKRLEFADKEQHDEGEPRHMNAAFGVLMFSGFLSLLASASAR